VILKESVGIKTETFELCQTHSWII